jgi:hypothetical protein
LKELAIRNALFIKQDPNLTSLSFQKHQRVIDDEHLEE